MHTTRRLASGAVAAMLAVAACGGDDDAVSSSTTAAPPITAAATTTPITPAPVTTTPSTAAPPTTVPPTTVPATTVAATTVPPATAPPTTVSGDELPETPVSAVLSDVYDFVGGTPDPDLLLVAPGSITSKWYRAGAVLAVVFEGLDPDTATCPGNSMLTADGFEFVSNAELPNASCPDFDVLIDSTPEQGIQLCGNRVGYLTLIPADTIGIGFASFAHPVPDVGGVGMSGSVEIFDPSVLPEIDPAVLRC